MERGIHSLAELEAEAARFIDTLVPRRENATLVTLSGELGAGKTAFTKALAKVLGVTETVNSPTFVLEKIYTLTNQKFKRLVHIDAYRLEKGADLAPLGFDDILKDTGTLVLLEWPEKVQDTLPIPAHTISFTLNTDGSRTLTYGEGT